MLHNPHLILDFFALISGEPIPVAARSKAWVCGRSLPGVAGSIPPGAWISVSCQCCVLSGRGLCDGLSLVQRSPTECGVSECDREASIMRRLWPTRGCCAMGGKNLVNSSHELWSSSWCGCFCPPVTTTLLSADILPTALYIPVFTVLDSIWVETAWQVDYKLINFDLLQCALIPHKVIILSNKYRL
jgi:hypothetical protein